MNPEKNITFEELYTMNYEITDIFAMYQTWSDGAIFKKDRPRRCNGLIFLNGCSGKYTNCHGETFLAPCKSFVCLPYGSEYTVLNLFSGMDSPDAFLVEFNIMKDNEKLTFSDSPFLIKQFNQYYIRVIVEKIIREYETVIKSPAVLKGLIYELLSYIGKEELLKHNEEYMPIAPAIEFMERNPTRKISVEQLAELCYVSSGCFRKLFKKYAGKSPVQYMIDIRIDMAKKMLEDSYATVEKIAEQLNFESSTYFCRIFKKKTNMTPTEYRNTI